MGGGVGRPETRRRSDLRMSDQECASTFARVRTETLKRENWDYVNKNPDLQEVLQDFMSSLLIHKPEDTYAFAREYFRVFREEGSGEVTADLKELDEEAERVAAEMEKTGENPAENSFEDGKQKLTTEASRDASGETQ